VVAALTLAAAGTLVQAQSQTPQTPPVFRAEANLVEVIVRVTDKEGRFLPDLTQADFALQEEGRAQTIVAFNRVDVPRAPVPVASTVRPPADPPLMSTVASNVGADDARLFVLLLDDVSTSKDSTMPVRRIARDFVERFVGPSDRVSVFSTGGWDRQTQEFTTDKSRVLATIDRYVGARCRGYESPPERIYNARVATDVIGALADHLTAVRGRRVSVLWISEGIASPNWGIVPFTPSNTFGNNIPTTAPTDPSAVVHAMNLALQALKRANVTVYAVDPRRLAADRTYWQKENPCGYLPAEGRDSLITFSEETGGFAAIKSNDYSPQFDRILDENSQYYVLGYQPDRRSRDGEYRRIRVRVTKPGFERSVVTARTGYTVSSPRDPEPGPPGATPAIAKAITSSLPSAALPLRVQAVPRRGQNGRGLVHVIVEASAAPLEFAEKNARFTERIEFGLLTADRLARQGNVQNVAMDLNLSPAELNQVRTSGVRWLTTLDLAPGHYSLRVAGHAVTSNRTGTIFIDVDVPKYEDNELRIDGVALTSLPAGLTMTSGTSPAALGLPGPPTSARTFVKGDVITVGAEIGVRRDFTSGAIELTVHPQAAAPDALPVLSRTLELADRTAAGQPRAVAVDTAALDAGPFILRLAVRDQEGRRAETAVLFDIVEPHVQMPAAPQP
jgi:VWFA-related protein